MARPHQRWPQNETLAPQDSHSEYFSIQICTYGCKWSATKNEGMAARLRLSCQATWPNILEEFLSAFLEPKGLRNKLGSKLRGVGEGTNDADHGCK
jgi:hypothetical protein